MRYLFRRDFLKLSLIPFFATFFGCSRSSELNQDISSAMQEEAFGYFLEVIFPTHLLGLQKYQESVVKRLKKLDNSDEKQIVKCYHLFKEKYKNAHGSFNSYTLAKGEAIIAQLLAISFFAEHSKITNQALDIIYDQISRVKELPNDLMGRKCSAAHKMCVYWYNYDEPASPIS